jgi:FkbM family methyltransferase
MNNFYSDKYYIFGAGNSAKLIRSTLESNGKKVIAFLTSQNTLKYIDNIPVVNLSENSIVLDIKIPVIIGVFNREPNASMSFISDYLNKNKFGNIISFFAWFDEYSSQIGNLYWLTNRKYYSENLSEYLLAKDLFKEKTSIDIYNNMLCFLQDFDFTKLHIPDHANQYFPKDLDVWDGKGVFLDIGSFDGQTVLDAFQKYGKLDTVIAYEPDSSNITLINRKITQFNPASHFFLVPCGVWSKTVILKFSSGGGESSAINNKGDISIQCLSLDETLYGVDTGYIKMDIEGAEYDALLGSVNSIKKYRPTLGICLYHKPDHLYKIPLLIKSWNLNYDFFIRFHGNNLFETVLYCVPKKNF